MRKSAPNYAAIAVKAAVGAVLGAGVAVAAGHSPLEWAAGGVLGFGVVFGALVSVHAAGDAKKLKALTHARKQAEEATTAQALGKLDKAERLWQEVLTIHEQALGENDLQTLSTIHSLANVQRLAGAFEKAQTLYRRALPLYGRLVAADHPALVQCHKDLAATLERLNLLPEAIEQAEKALAVEGAASTRSLVARLHTAAGQDRSAIEHYKLLLEAAPPDQAETLNEQGLLAACYVRERMHAEATEMLKDLLLKLKKVESPNRQLEAEAFLNLAESRLAQGIAKDAEPLALTGLKVVQAYVGPSDRLLGRLFAAYREGREKTGAGLKENDLLVLFSEPDREKARAVLKANPEWVNLKDKTGWGPLQWAAFLNREDLLKWLLRNGARPDNYDAKTVLGPIHVAAAWGKLSALESLLDAGADIDSPGPGGLTPLCYSAQQGRAEVARQLVVRGARPGRADDQGRTALHHAAAAGHREVVENLLAQGADLQACTAKGRTALHEAAWQGQGAVVELLLAHQADPQQPDGEGRSALALAELAGHSLLVKTMS